jgi:CheY-like chemotaxis protein
VQAIGSGRDPLVTSASLDVTGRRYESRVRHEGTNDRDLSPAFQGDASGRSRWLTANARVAGALCRVAVLVYFAADLEREFMTIRILLVDDHPVVRHGLKSLLAAQPDCEVIDEAADGVEAVEKARRLDPDVVLLDITMPRMNGLEACRLIHQSAPHCEVLMLTQHDSRQMLREALDAGARGYVVKSQAGRDLVTAVEEVSQHHVFIALGNSNTKR